MTATGTVKTATPASVAPLAADLDAALRRLKLATVRRNAAEVLQVAKTQRWTPEEILRTLVEAEIAARDASNTANRLKAAAFPVTKTLDGFDVSGSSVTQATFDYLSSLEWIRAQQNLAVVGPPGTGKSHLLISCGHAAVHAGFKVRYFTAADLIEVLYRGLADNTVGKIIDTLLRADLVILDEIGFAPLDDTGRVKTMKPICIVVSLVSMHRNVESRMDNRRVEVIRAWTNCGVNHAAGYFQYPPPTSPTWRFSSTPAARPGGRGTAELCNAGQTDLSR
jgi:DNA replication protein DnaC